jgi:hypothetical protein
MTKQILLTSGRHLGVNDGYVGINDELQIAQGYAGPLEVVSDRDALTPYEVSPAEAKELADIMIDRWTRFKGNW